MKRLEQNLLRALIVALIIIGIRLSQDVEDGIKLLGYQPSPAVARLATTTTMTDTARRLFYVNKPTIETKKLGLNRCSRNEQTIVLGCYVSNQGIFLKSVTDPNLQGVMEVTAAHEMLHVAYDRMSLVEQKQIDSKLQAVLDKLQNPRIIKLIQMYEKNDPRSVNSELHSIFGTELRHLTPELEQYYQNYFTNRLTVVALSERYEGVFTALKDKAKNLSEELTTRKAELERLSEQVKLESQAITSQKGQIQTVISNSPLTDNSFIVADFNNRVNSYNQLVSQLKQQTDIYNQMITEFNSLVIEQKSLLQSLDKKSTE
jgi:hypothetical protein